MFDLIAFDADDTLWHNERLYQMGRDRFRELLSSYSVQGPIDELLDQTEIRNIPFFGYGVKSFVLSQIETAVKLTAGRISGHDVTALVELAREMLTAEVELFDEAEQTLAQVSSRYPLILITKGDLLHQQTKFEQSGLKGYFQHLEVVSGKTIGTYRTILHKHRVEPSRFLMVGNALRSDILPVAELGGWAVYVPHELTWLYEEVHLPEGLPDRCFEVERIGLVPEMIERIARERGG
jgi:putative hydrolase of the HAD superfamily